MQGWFQSVQHFERRLIQIPFETFLKNIMKGNPKAIYIAFEAKKNMKNC